MYDKITFWRNERTKNKNFLRNFFLYPQKWNEWRENRFSIDCANQITFFTTHLEYGSIKLTYCKLYACVHVWGTQLGRLNKI